MNNKLKAVALLAAAGLSAGLLAGLLLTRSGNAAIGLALVVGLGIVTVILTALGVNLLISAKKSEAGIPEPPADYRHTYRLFGTLIGLIVVVLGLRSLAVPSTMGQYGWWRGGAQKDIASRDPRQLGEAACAKCHEAEVRLHDKDAHATVPCESCHGVGWKHAADPKEVHLVKPAKKEWCLTCHRKTVARPGTFAQIRLEDHYKSVWVKDASVDCTKCHSPHEPLYMDRDLRTARLHPLINRCRDCHLGREDDKMDPRPEKHPPIFECVYCHKEKVEDFKTRTHKNVRCTTCHLFFKQSDSAGRIIRDADPRFCLLCHRKVDFRNPGPGEPPAIEWPSHREEMAGDPELAKNGRCIDCHLENIHKPVDKPVAKAAESQPAATQPTTKPAEKAGDTKEGQNHVK